MAAVTAPKKVSVGCIWDSNGQGWYGTNHGLPNWQDARFQVCFTWQDDGEVCTANNTNYQADTAVWLDEFTVNPTTYVATGESGSYSGQHYFGTRTTPAWTMLSNGVYATQYYNAVTGRTTIVFCNLTGSSPQTINMAANFPGFTKLQKITGSQTSGQGINNGAQVASFVIQGHDGLIGYGVP